jgi:hypothetical protein
MKRLRSGMVRRVYSLVGATSVRRPSRSSVNVPGSLPGTRSMRVRRMRGSQRMSAVAVAPNSFMRVAPLNGWSISSGISEP